MQEFQSIPVHVSAIQLTENNAAEVVEACEGQGRLVVEIDSFDENRKIETVNVMFLEGGKRMKLGDWLLVYPHLPDRLPDLEIKGEEEFLRQFEEL